ncbi:hypothetical protein RclHR1_08460004 [Rhizophagus clarus]|uniref:VLIG-type G domain-containing protein n=1 Tax=Rhizophagus clarus TaxID=94130 RepID=A0A2Z6SN64_9GLOM|nr:hypothetical protein RclHR1_08460004 [Rhizophagus clarus]
MNVVVCSGGLSGLIFALSLSEIFVVKNISGNILVYHEDVDSKNQLLLVNEHDFLRLPKNIRDYVSSAAVFKEIFSDQQQFNPTSTEKYDLLVLADGYGDLCNNFHFEKKATSERYELKIDFQTPKGQLQNDEVLSLLQTRYFMQIQDNDQNFLKINLSKSEYDNIELDASSNLNLIKNNPWLINMIRDGFQIFEINIDVDLASVIKGSDNLLVSNEFYKSQRDGQNESFVCVIGDSAFSPFDYKSWQNRSTNLGIAISTATILAEQLAVEHENTRNKLNEFSNAMLNFQKRLEHRFQLTSMNNILLKVTNNIIDNYNEQHYMNPLSSINPSDFMSFLKKYPQLFGIDCTYDDGRTYDHEGVNILDGIKEKYNTKPSAPETFLKKLDKIQIIANYFIIFESFLSFRNLSNNEESSNDAVSDLSSKDSDDSSDEETSSDSLDGISLEEFFNVTFGEEEINYDATIFITDELTKEVFKDKVVSCLKDPTKGILRNIFPHIVDIINRTISLQRIQDCIQQISEEIDDPSQLLRRLANCKGRDYLVAFLDKVPKKEFSKVLLSLIRANIPIPLLFTNKNEYSQKGLRVLREMHNLTLQNYHLLLSFNLSTSELDSPFSKKLYSTICKHRENRLSITSAGSIDISFHSASENNGRKPVAITEVYFEENPHQTLISLISSFSQFAFYMFLHVNDQDFEGNSPSSELKKLLDTIVTGSSNDQYLSEISVIYWSKLRNNDPFSRRKKNLKKLLEQHFNSECIKIEQISNDLNQFIEKKKDDVFKQLSKPGTKIICPPLYIKLSETDKEPLNIWKSEIEESLFASKMEFIKFESRSDIFRATHLEYEIEALNDMRSTTKSQRNSKFMSEGEILSKIQRYREEQLELSTKEPLSIFIDFAQLINENNIEKMRNFAYQIDVYFKKYLRELQILNIDTERDNIRLKIEENDISIHDFWREFIILSELSETKYSNHPIYETNNLMLIKYYHETDETVLKQLYNVSQKKLQEAYKTWILEGEPLQLLDGLSLRSLPTKFLSNVLSNLMTNVKRRLVVISVIGLESSGKSTLLNYLFHCGFATSASRCTKGVYMSYRTANFDEKIIDLLILDSEGMASTAQKHTTNRTDFDRKITLLALMCSQIVIINTKGLTRDIGDILEVSSWHLDAMRHRDSKARLHFVLRDMVDTTMEAQEPAFKDIVDGLKRMFKLIPGSEDKLENFMSIERKDVHLLENAFSCYQDDFRPRVANIDKTDNINLPAEVFPAKISSLRKSFLKSALSTENASKQFTNVQGFIPYMKTVWSKINIFGNFLHFKSFNEIQEWHQMRFIVSNIKETKLSEFTTKAKNIINHHLEELQSDYSKWSQIDETFRKELDLLTENLKTVSIRCYLDSVQEQFYANIVEEGKILIYNMIAEERREQDAQWMTSVREYKDSWLSQCAMEKVGENIKRLNRNSKKIDKTECKQIFEETWKEVEDDRKDFIRRMIFRPEDLKQHVQGAFNNAVKDFCLTVRPDSKQKEKEKFKKDFCARLQQPSTLEEHVDIDIQKIQNIIEVEQNIFSYFKQRTNKKEIAQEIKDKLEQIVSEITSDLDQKSSLHIEYGQTIKWYEKLCNCLFEFTQLPTSKIEFNTDFDFIEKYLRSQIYVTLRNNSIRWKNKQNEKLNKLKTDLFSSFQKILTDHSNESLSNEVLSYILVAFRQQLEMKEKTIGEKLQNYLKQGWTDTNTAANYAYNQTFGVLDINAIREYLKNPTEYMINLFNNDYNIYSKILVDSTLHEIDDYCKILKGSLIKAVSVWSASFDTNKKHEQSKLSDLLHYLSEKYNINIENPVPENNLSKILKDVNNLFGSIIIEKPVDFCKLLISLIEIRNIHDIWTDTDKLESKKRMSKYLKAKITYWNRIGCLARCPLCSSKCELPNDGHTQHQVTKHLLPAFSGFRGRDTRHPTLIVCTENAAHDEHRWGYYRDSIYLPLTKFLSKYHPSWLPFPRSEPSDEHVAKMRAIWWKLKDELCEKYDMIDNTDPSWEFRYGSLIPE